MGVFFILPEKQANKKETNYGHASERDNQALASTSIRALVTGKLLFPLNFFFLDGRKKQHEPPHATERPPKASDTECTCTNNRDPFGEGIDGF